MAPVGAEVGFLVGCSVVGPITGANVGLVEKDSLGLGVLSKDGTPVGATVGWSVGVV